LVTRKNIDGTATHIIEEILLSIKNNNTTAAIFQPDLNCPELFINILFTYTTTPDMLVFIGQVHVKERCRKAAPALTGLFENPEILIIH